MKNLLLILTSAIFMMSCSTNSGNWTPEQKQEFKDHILRVERLAYVNNMTPEEFEKFANDVAASAEINNPDYNTFMATAGVEDSIVMFTVTRFDYDVNSDFRSMRHIYPYSQLVNDGILPQGLSRELKEVFYSCLAAKIRAKYENIGFFLGQWGTSGDAERQAVIFQQQCAMELGDAMMIQENITE